MSPFNINLELFEKNQNIEKYIRYNGKETEKLKINIKARTSLFCECLQKTVSGKKCDAHDSKKRSRFSSRLKGSNVWMISCSMSFYARILPGPTHYGIVVIESFQVSA